MFPQIELFCVGFASVVDVVLLLVVLERINRPLTAIWLKWALLGATLWHVASFLHALLRETEGQTALWVDGVCMTGMATGMLLLNCGILHGGLRIHRSGAVAHPTAHRRFIMAYLPVVLIVPLAFAIFQSGSRDFIEATRQFHLPFLIWLPAANLTAAWLLVQSRHRVNAVVPGAGSFLVKFSIGLIVITGLVGFYLLFAQQSRFEPYLRLLTNLSPLAPTLVFGWYLVQRRLLPMVFERTLVYGALLIALFYLHRLTISPVTSNFSQEFHFDFVVIEGLALVAIVLAYQPLRNRVREGLRYFLDGDVSTIRNATRELSIELSRRADDEIEALSLWFVQELRQALNLRYVQLTVCHSSSAQALLFINAADNESADELQMTLSGDSASMVTNAVGDCADGWIDCSRARSFGDHAVMRELDLAAVFRVHYRNVDGRLMLGSPLSRDRLSHEQIHTVSMLVDQYAATIHNRTLEQARQHAERRAMQQEKLSTLGLLSGSLAHELKNPLSSIRTIATLLREDLGDQSEFCGDMDLIVSEMDRLAETTDRLLAFSKPSDSLHVGIDADVVIQRLLSILDHLARQHGVELGTDLQLQDQQVEATDASLSEIVFNLIKNAIEAARDSDCPSVSVSTRVESDDQALAVIVVTDNGPGISGDLQQDLFEPFVSGKMDGTGLGLFVVGQRVRELGVRSNIQRTSVVAHLK